MSEKKVKSARSTLTWERKLWTLDLSLSFLRKDFCLHMGVLQRFKCKFRGKKTKEFASLSVSLPDSKVFK